MGSNDNAISGAPKGCKTYLSCGTEAALREPGVTLATFSKCDIYAIKRRLTRGSKRTSNSATCKGPSGGRRRMTKRKKRRTRSNRR